MTTKRLQNAGYISKTDSILAVICIIPVWICRNYSYIVFMDIFKLSEHFLNQEAMVMPRIRQKENEYRNEDFRREVLSRLAYLGLNQTDLAKHMGVSKPTMSGLLHCPDKISVERLRKIISYLQLEPSVVLRLCGYDSKTVKEYK